MHDLRAALQSGRVLLMDGAMGTELMRLTGSPTLPCGEAFNLTHADLVRTIHRAYLDAGAEVLLTNTFQANPAALAKHGRADQLKRIWREAIRLAQGVDERSHFVLADVGPFFGDARENLAPVFAECVGVDGVLLETWTSLAALPVAAELLTAQEVPLLVSFTFHRKRVLFTSENETPEACALAANACGAVALGANCGLEIDGDDLREIVRRFRSVCELPIFVRPNAGTPTRNNSGWQYPRSSEQMTQELMPLLAEGIAMIGGCCGTTPAHIRRFRTILDDV